MPANKNALTRYKILDELLSDRYHCYTLDDLTEKVNDRLASLGIEPVVRRSIEKDIKYLELDSEFMVEIERYTAYGEFSYDKESQKVKTKRCLRYLDPSFSIFKKALSSDEKYLLKELLSLVGQFDGLPFLGTLEDMQNRLKVSDGTKIISLSKNPLEGSNLFGELFLSISHQQVIRITYHTFKKKDYSSNIILSPYLLKEYNRRWFLIGAAEDGKLLTFGLDQIDSVTTLPSNSYVPYDGNIEDYYEDVIGVTHYVDRPVEHIVFWVNQNSKNYVLSKPLHESQRHYSGKSKEAFSNEYPLLKDGEFFSIDVIPNYEMIRELMSFGEDLIVLSPSTIRSEIISRLKNNLKIY